MSEPVPQTELLVCIIKDHHQVEEILTGFLELGLRGATVLDGRGMGQILSTDIPIFAGFRSLFPSSNTGTYVILSVVEKRLLADAVRLAEEVCGSLDQAGTGFLFTMPVNWVKGFAPAIQ